MPHQCIVLTLIPSTRESTDGGTEGGTGEICTEMITEPMSVCMDLGKEYNHNPNYIFLS